MGFKVSGACDEMRSKKHTLRVGTSKSQASLEYLIILGIALFLLIPIIGLFYSSSADSQSQTSSNLNIINGRKLVSSAETVFYQGKNSKLKVQLTFPDNIESIAIKNGTLEITSVFDGETSAFVFFSSIPLALGDCDSQASFITDNSFLAGGSKQLFVKSCGNNVSIYDFPE
jgi:uncharacterized protein (UPF0333 family)